MPYKKQKDRNMQHIRRYHRRVKAGLCPYCNEPSVSGRTRCLMHSLRARVKRMMLSDNEQTKAILAYNSFIGRCDICGSDNPRDSDWNIDHCHYSNKFRGILCHRCNCVLGYAGNSIDVFEKAITYLKKFEESIK